MPGNDWLRMWQVCMHNVCNDYVCMIVNVCLWRNFAIAYAIAIFALFNLLQSTMQPQGMNVLFAFCKTECGFM